MSITVGFNLVHLEYSASYLISCRDSGKPTETNLDVHRFRYLVYCERGTKKLGLLFLVVRKLDPFYTLQKAQQLLRKMWIGNPLGVIGNKV